MVAATAGRFMHGMAPRFPLGIGLLLIGAGALLRVTMTAQSGWTVLIPGLAVTGVGVGLASPVLVSAALAAVPRPRSGMASGAVNTFRQVGYALGIAAFGSGFTGRLGRTMTGSGLFRDPVAAAAQASQGGVRALVAASPQHAAASHVVHAAYATGQNSVYLAAGIAAVTGGVLALAFIRTDRPAGTAAVAPANQASAAGAVGR